MNKIIEKDATLYIDSSEKKVFLDIYKGAKVRVFHFVKDHDVSIQIHLRSAYSSVLYYYSNINYDNHNVQINIHHHDGNTISNIYSHGVNVKDGNLHFMINGIIPKDVSGVVCNQENQIINLHNGKSTICPNLFIDSYDVSSSHSAYIGRFHPEELFYLQSRGFDETGAYQLLMKGFLIPSFVDDKLKEECLSEIQKI